MNKDEILEIVTYLAQKLEKDGYKSLAGSIRKAKSLYNREITYREDQLTNAKKLLTNSLIKIYNFFYIKEDLINKPLEFLEKEIGVKDAHFYYNNQKISLKGLKESQKALKELREVINYAYEIDYLEDRTLEGWDLWEQLRNR